MPYATETSEGVILHVRVQPRAARDEFAGLLGERVKIRLQSPPVDGKANKALLRFVARRFKGTGSKPILKRGHTSRDKDLLLPGLTAKTVSRVLGLPDPGDA